MRRHARWWSVGLWFTSLLLALPMLVVLTAGLSSDSANWTHLRATVLTDYVRNSALLTIGVGLGSLGLGVSTAWLTARFRFPGSRWLSWAMLLPMAMPAYIIAYTYTGMLDFAGPLQTWLRGWTGWRYGDYWFPEVRSLGGAVLMLSLVLYPYVYLLARSAFVQQSARALEVGRSLGLGPWGSFFYVALPLARPAIAGGMALVMMESLADYGTVAYFGLGVFTTGIFRTWFGMGDAAAAARLASLLLLTVLLLLILERHSRRHARFHQVSASPALVLDLTGAKAWLASLACMLPLILGFLLPATQLTGWALNTWRETLDEEFVRLTLNSLGLALGSAMLIVLLALFLAYARRLLVGPLVNTAVGLAASGYAIPGAVIAVGVIIPLAWADNQLDAAMRDWFGLSTGLLLSGSLFALLFAYCVRFLAVGLHAVDSGLQRIKPSMDEAARLLGRRPGGVLWRIHLPLMQAPMFTALLLVFVDVMKELPATLILRPFNFNTLAVRAWELAADERLAESSSAALMIVVAGLLPVWLLSRKLSRGHS